jgi:hypothetical protein
MPTLSFIRRTPLLTTVGFVLAAPVLSVTLGVALGACGSSSATGGTGGGTSTKSGTGGVTTTTGTLSTGSLGSGGSSTVVTCPASMKYGGGETSVTGRSVKAKIVDETGAPVAGQPIFICGLNVCTSAPPGQPPYATQADGTAIIATMLAEMKPAFKFGDAVSYAELAIPLTQSTIDFTNGGTAVIATGKLAGKPGAALTPGTSATSGDVTITLPAGSSVGINQLVYGTADQMLFRSVNIPLANVGPVLDPVLVDDAGAGFGLLYGVAPAETTLCPAAQVTVSIPASLGWTAGAAVEFWIMTTDTGQTYAPYAGWAKHGPRRRLHLPGELRHSVEVMGRLGAGLSSTPAGTPSGAGCPRSASPSRTLPSPGAGGRRAGRRPPGSSSW